jgi:3',5'-cyclic-AMP phosphodiesterase
VLRLGFVTDIHFGPQAFHEGKLRKMTHQAEPLLRQALSSMLEAGRPDLLVNLGDDVEDESRPLDLERYALCQEILREPGVTVVNVAGNHDMVHMGRDDLNRFWGRTGPLYHAFDHKGFHVVVLQTFERAEIDCSIPAPQLEWLESDLSRTRLPSIVLMHHSAADQDLGTSRWFDTRPELALLRERADLRRILERSGKVRAVFNGHVHRNDMTMHGGIPYVTFQSLTENLDDDAPGRPSGAWAIAEIDTRKVDVRVHGADPARWTVESRARPRPSP